MTRVQRRERSKRRALTSVKGFTLIEVLVALIVLSIGLLGIAGLQASSMRSNYSAYLRSQAAVMAYDIMDRMRANRAAVNAESYDIIFTKKSDLPTGTNQYEQDLLEWGSNIVDLLPSGNASVDFDPATSMVTVTVQWDDSRADRSPDRNIATVGTTTQTFQFLTEF